MNKRLSLSICLTIFAFSIFAQGEKDSIDFTTFRHEIALDFQAPLRNRLNGTTNGGSSLATSILYRRRLATKKELNRALRLQVGGRLNIPVGSTDIFSNGNTGNENLFVTRNQFASVFANIGLEWQRQMGRMQFYHGLDSGIEHFRDVGVLEVRRINNSGDVLYYREGKEVTTSVPLIGFFGLKYFLHPRFSIAYEAAMFTEIRFRREQIDRYVPTQSDPVENEFNYRRTEITLFFNFLRDFHLSYYF